MIEAPRERLVLVIPLDEVEIPRQDLDFLADGVLASLVTNVQAYLLGGGPRPGVIGPKFARVIREDLLKQPDFELRPAPGVELRPGPEFRDRPVGD